MTQYESQYERMIKQPIPSLILTLALPTTISMLVTNIYITWLIRTLSLQ